MIERIEGGLEEGLGYAVPTVLRSEAELGGRSVGRASPSRRPTLAAATASSRSSCSPRQPKAAAREAVAAHWRRDEDRSPSAPRELFWLPSGRISDSDLDLRAIEKQLPPGTMRTKGTIEQLSCQAPSASE